MHMNRNDETQREIEGKIQEGWREDHGDGSQTGKTIRSPREQLVGGGGLQLGHSFICQLHPLARIELHIIERTGWPLGTILVVIAAGG